MDRICEMASSSPPKDFLDRLATVVSGYPSQQAAADAAGVSLSQLKRYLAGQNEPSLSAVTGLAGGANVSLEWLISGAPTRYYGWGDYARLETAPSADPSALPDTWASLPVFDVRAGAGSGAINEWTIERYSIAVEERWARAVLGTSSKTISGILVAGDSMEPTLRDGDIALVDLRQAAMKVDGVYVLRVGEQLLVKRLSRRLDGKILVRSDNPIYPEELVDPTEVDVGIYGRVIAAFHQF